MLSKNTCSTQSLWRLYGCLCLGTWNCKDRWKNNNDRYRLYVDWLVWIIIQVIDISFLWYINSRCQCCLLCYPSCISSMLTAAQHP